MDQLTARKKVAASARRVVIKVGTRLLTDVARIPVLIGQIAALRAKGVKPILVSSGAVGLGMRTLSLAKRPARLSDVQALAAIGQSKLMALYEKAASHHGFHVAQLLLTAGDLSDREKHLNALNCVNSLWDMDILPIINENDSVAVDELKFGDNDILSGLISSMTRCELTIILTMVDGLRQVDADGRLGERISIVGRLDDKIRSLAVGTDDPELSKGGMASKLKAAEIVLSAGLSLWIANGADPDVLGKILQGDDVGTLFTSSQGERLSSRKRWLSFFTRPRGRLTIDDGAVKAIVDRGRSLLPSGITAIEGDFSRGDTVEIVTSSGQTVAKGLSNYSGADAAKLKGHKSSMVKALLGYDGDEEVIHRDNLVLSGKP